MEKDASHERLHPVQERPLKGGIAILMGNLNTKVGFDNTWLGHVERGFDSTASSLVASWSCAEPATRSVRFQLIDSTRAIRLMWSVVDLWVVCWIRVTRWVLTSTFKWIIIIYQQVWRISPQVKHRLFVFVLVLRKLSATFYRRVIDLAKCRTLKADKCTGAIGGSLLCGHGGKLVVTKGICAVTERNLLSR